MMGKEGFIMKVTFNQVGEFIDELEKDAGKVERNLVRCTKLFEPSRLSPTIRLVSIFSTYSVAGQVITLTRYCGDIWGINREKDNEVIAKADAYLKSIEKACKHLKLEVRAGMLEE